MHRGRPGFVLQVVCSMAAFGLIPLAGAEPEPEPTPAGVNPFELIKEAMAKLEAEREAAEHKRMEAERLRLAEFQAFYERRRLAADPAEAIRLAREKIARLEALLARQTEEIARLRTQSEAEAQRGKDQNEEFKKQIAELKKQFEERQKKIDERAKQLQSADAGFDKRIGAAADQRRELQKSMQHVINRLRERVLLDFESQSFDGIEFVKIPAGSFTMGASDGQREELKRLGMWNDLNQCETPARTVTITRPFFISKFEITQKQWTEHMDGNPSAFKGDDLPIESINWLEANRYLKKLADKTGGTYRLPTEAEWEYCARAGGEGPFGRGEKNEPITPESQGGYAWTSANSESKTHNTGVKSPNAWGLHDMLGNVWEWCIDTFDCEAYEDAPDADPRHTSKSTEHSFRGGAWGLEPMHARVATRGGNLTRFRSRYVGFRVVREITKP